MHRSLPAILGAALLAAAAATAADETGAPPAPAAEDGVALGQLPADQLEGMILEALPIPPTTVVRNTHYFGTVTIDHAAHLQRKASCKRCHDPGPVGKIAFTPKVAHSRCIGCHQEVAKGPTKCNGCHVMPPPPPPTVVEAPPPPQPNAANLSAAVAAFDAPRDPPPEPFHREFQVGYGAGTGQGFSAAFVSNADWRTFTVSVERLASDAQACTSGVLGAGVRWPLRDRLAVEGLGLFAFDIYDRPLVALLPALGARAGVTWYTRLPIVSSVSAKLTALFDLGSHSAGGMEVGGASAYVTISTGFSLSRSQ